MSSKEHIKTTDQNDRGAEKNELRSPDADKVRHAGSNEMAQVENARTGKSSGSLAEDPAGPSVEIHAIDNTGKAMKFSRHTGLTEKDLNTKAFGFDHDVTLPVPDFKSVGQPGAIPRFVTLKLGPEDNAEVQRRYKEELAGRDPAKLSEFDRQKLQTLAVCDTVIHKYEEALSKQELQDAKKLPEQARGLFLAGQALSDGAALGGAKSVLHKVIDEGALGDLASGTAIGIAFGKIVTRLAANVNPWTRGAAILLQTGGVGLLAKQIGDVGHAGITGMLNSFPALNDLINHPDEKHLANAKGTVEKQLGPPLADTALIALGFAVAHKIDSTVGGSKPAPGKPPRVSEHSNTKPSEKLAPGEEPLTIKDVPPEESIHTGAALIRPPWKVYNLRKSPDVLVQTHDESCVSAVGEMLSKLLPADRHKTEAELVKVLGGDNPIEKVDMRLLAGQLGPEWRGVYIGEPNAAQIRFLTSTGPFGASLKLFGHGGHMVFVEGMNARGRLEILDPAYGYRYEMALQDFAKAVQGVVHR